MFVNIDDKYDIYQLFLEIFLILDIFGNWDSKLLLGKLEGNYATN